MQALRSHFMHMRWRWVALLVLTLGVRLLVAPGMMIGSEEQSFTVRICAGIGLESVRVTVPVERSGAPEPAAPHAAPAVCAFAAALDMVSGADLPALVLATLALALLPGVLPAPPLSLPQPARLRPPLRGPPLFI